MTERALADAIGDPSPGNVHNNLAALRFRGALSWRSTGYGPGARIRWLWPGAVCRGGIGTHAFRSSWRRIGRSEIDSHAPYGGFLTVGAYARRLLRERGGIPPDPSRSAAGAGLRSASPAEVRRSPPRWGVLPRRLVGTCSSDHLVSIGRLPSRTDTPHGGRSQAVYWGHCPRPRCGRLVEWHRPTDGPAPREAPRHNVYVTPNRARLARAILAADPSAAPHVSRYLEEDAPRPG